MSSRSTDTPSESTNDPTSGPAAGALVGDRDSAAHPSSNSDSARPEGDRALFSEGGAPDRALFSEGDAPDRALFSEGGAPDRALSSQGDAPDRALFSESKAGERDRDNGVPPRRADRTELTRAGRAFLEADPTVRTLNGIDPVEAGGSTGTKARDLAARGRSITDGQRVIRTRGTGERARRVERGLPTERDLRPPPGCRTGLGAVVAEADVAVSGTAVLPGWRRTNLLATQRGRLIAVGLAVVVCTLSRWLLRPAWPDDYDSIGFVLGVDDFDLRRFQPHAPGYPVYLALARILRALGLSALDATTGVSALAAGVSAAALYVIARELRGPRAGLLAVAFFTVASLPWLLGTMALSDATALAFGLVATAAWLRGRVVAAAVLIGLLLGVRLSYFPLALVGTYLLLARRRTAPILLGLSAGIVAWAVPFALIVGKALPQLVRTHVAGHFRDWGGSVVTRPSPWLRLGCFVRDLVFDGLAPELLTLALVLAVVGLALQRRPSLRLAGQTTLALLPYALWVLLGQNVVEQPRHVLPLVAALIVGMACLFARPGTPFYLGLLALVGMAAQSAPLAWTHAHQPPPAVAAAEHLSAAFAPGDTVVFGGRAARLIRFAAPGLATRERTWLSEVDVDLARVNSLPPHIHVTSEVEADASRRRRLQPGPLFCRDARLDRTRPCLQLFEYSLVSR